MIAGQLSAIYPQHNDIQTGGEIRDSVPRLRGILLEESNIGGATRQSRTRPRDWVESCLMWKHTRTGLRPRHHRSRRRLRTVCIRQII